MSYKLEYKYPKGEWDTLTDYAGPLIFETARDIRIAERTLRALLPANVTTRSVKAGKDKGS